MIIHVKDPNATRMVFFREAGFFLDEIESPERVTMSEKRLSGCLHTSRIVADSVKNSSESSISERGYLGFFSKNYFRGFRGFCVTIISFRFGYRHNAWGHLGEISGDAHPLEPLLENFNKRSPVLLVFKSKMWIRH